MTLTDLDNEPCRDDADKAATDHVDEAQAAKEKVSNEVRKPQGYDQERIYKGQCIERRGDADLIRAKRNAWVTYKMTMYNAMTIAATVMRFVFAKKLYIGVPPSTESKKKKDGLPNNPVCIARYLL